MQSVVVRAASLVKFDEPTALDWSPNGNIIAVAIPRKTGSVARVYIFEPEALHENDVLEVPLVSDRDDVAFLSFSPVRATLTLLTATRQGSLLLWSPREGKECSQPIAVNTWTPRQVSINHLESLIVAKFLTPPSSYRWPPRELSYKPTESGIPLEKRFFAVDHIVAGEQAWLRSGALHFITLDVSGVFYVYWETFDGMKRTKKQELQELLPGRWFCADIIGGRGATVRIAAVTDANPLYVTLLDIRGHPRDAASDTISFSITMVCRLKTTIDHPISDIGFAAESLGNCLIVFQKSCDSVAISKHEPNPHDRSSFVESKRLILDIEGIDTELFERISMHLSPEGSSTVFCVPGYPSTLISLTNLSIVDRLEDNDSAADCISGIFSPNGVSFVGVVRLQQQYGLRIWSLSEVSAVPPTSLENPKALCLWDCMRLAWASLTNADPWDVCERVKRHRSEFPEQLMYFSLFYLDSMIHRHPHVSRPHYSDTIDKLKIRILQDSEDPAAQAVVADLYSRKLISKLFHGFTSSFVKSDRSTVAVSAADWTASDRESCSRWIAWMRNYVQFFYNCLKTWICRAQSSSTGSSGHVPFIRLLADKEFIRDLSLLLVCFTGPRSELSHEAGTFLKDGSKTVQRIYSIVKQANTQSGIRDFETWEAIEAFRSLVSQTRKTCCGPVHLHYARVNGPVTPDVMRLIGQQELVHSARELTQVEIVKEAISLGILPDRALKGYLQILSDRRHNPLQAISPTPLKGKLPIFDSLQGKRFIEGNPVFYSADQSCITSFLPLQKNEQGEEASRLDVTLLKQCSIRSPFTGSLWKKLTF